MQHSNIKQIILSKNSEGGFVLIAAIMAVMILIAVGFFALTVTTQDLRISARLVDERMALSAAEAGIQETLQQVSLFTGDSQPASLNRNGVVVDASTRYDIFIQSVGQMLVNIPGYSGPVGKVPFTTLVNGRVVSNLGLTTRAQADIEIGAATGAVPIGTEYNLPY